MRAREAGTEYAAPRTSLAAEGARWAGAWQAQHARCRARTPRAKGGRLARRRQAPHARRRGMHALAATGTATRRTHKSTAARLPRCA
eukprot:6175700-Pleurochrysis_carterae.AAC.1